MDKVLEALADVSRYGFHFWNSQAMKVVDNKSIVSSSKHSSKQDWKEAESTSGDEKGIVEPPVTNTVDAMSVENGVTVNVCVFNMSDYP